MRGSLLTASSPPPSLFPALPQVISAGGYREDVTLHTIRTNLEMESHEEKLAQVRGGAADTHTKRPPCQL